MSTLLADYYQQDFYLWINKNVALLKAHRLSELDINNLTEEIATLGRAEKRSLMSHLTVLIKHLLKWQYQPHKRTKSWKLTIKQQRREIQDCLTESPSLKHTLPDILHQAFNRGFSDVIDETGLSPKKFPTENPYTFSQLIDEQFLPD